MTDVVVLGWDGLDLELVEQFGLGEAFGSYRTTIDTHVNPIVDEPHTLELWPSMITGLPPDEHGVVAVTESEGVEWGNPVLDVASTVGNQVLPHEIMIYLGAKVRELGAGPDITKASYYRERDIETVFESCGGHAISIPNYQTDADRAHGLDAHRDRLWQALDVSYAGEGTTPGVAVPQIYDELGAAVGRRLGHTLMAIDGGEPLVWTWFGLLDSVGHMEPAVGDQLVADWYRTAAQITRQVRAQAPADTAVLAVSDHGIQEGEHTHYATLCADDPTPVEEIGHVFGIADWLRSQEFERGATERQISDAGRETVRETLADMGYIES
jgi:hypothetical protein